MPGEIDLVTGKPIKNKERELLSALTPEEKAARKERRKQKKQEEAIANGEFVNPVSEPGAVFDVEGSPKASTGDGDKSDSSDYEWATTDSDSDPL